MRFRVALDARRMHGNKRGVGQYIRQLATRLPKLSEGFEFVLLVDRELDSGDVPSGCRQVRVGAAFSTKSQSRSGLGAKAKSLYWMNLLVPETVRREGIALFHGTNFALPLLRPGLSVVTVHDFIYARAPGAFEPMYELYLKALMPRVAKCSRAVIAVSEATKRDMVELVGIQPSKVQVVHHGVGEEYTPAVRSRDFEVKSRHSLPERFILHVGAVERRKMLDVLVRAAAPLMLDGTVDAVILAGEEGYGAEAVHIAAAEAGVSDRVRFLGYVSQDDLPSLYRLAEVLTLASVYEGFGMPVLEAMASGTPVVVSDVSSLPEIAGDAALMVRPGDAGGLRKALHRLLTDGAEYDEFKSRGLQRASRFTWQKTARDHLELYKRVLEG